MQAFLEPFFDTMAAAATAAHNPAAPHNNHRYVHAHHKPAHHGRDQQQQQQPKKPALRKAAPEAPSLPAPKPKPSMVVPACNVYESDTAYYIQLDMPGATDPEVVALAEKLTVKADVAADAAVPEGARLLRRERPARVARYERTFTLPDAGVDTDSIEARLDAGVLTITVPKVAPQPPAVKRVKVVTAGATATGAAETAAAPAAPTAPAPKKVVRIAVDEDDDEGSIEDASEEMEA